MQFIDFTLSGYLIPIAEALTSLLPLPQGAAFDDSYIQRADAENLAKMIIAKRTTGVEPANEIRVHDLHRGPLPGGDNLFSPLNSNTSIPVGGVFAEEIGGDLGLATPNPNASPAQAEQDMARIESEMRQLQAAVDRIKSNT